MRALCVWSAAFFFFTFSSFTLRRISAAASDACRVVEGEEMLGLLPHSLLYWLRESRARSFGLVCIQLLLELVSRDGDESAWAGEISARKTAKNVNKKHIANTGRTGTQKKMSKALAASHTHTHRLTDRPDLSVSHMHTYTPAGVRVSVFKTQAQGHLQQKDEERQRKPLPKPTGIPMQQQTKGLPAQLQ